jgi:hypothetical protein
MKGSKMKLITSTMMCLSLFATNVYADGHEQKEEEKSGLYYNGNVEMYIDGEWPEGDMSSRAEVFAGFQTELNDGPFNWAGAGARYDTNYSLDRTLDNTVQEKQMGFGIGNTRVYIGETDAQRLGFAKTSKIGAPVIVIEPNSRIDHKEKVVVTFGDWVNNDEFKFNQYKLQRKKLPIGGIVGYEPETKSMYAGATARLAIFDVSYLQISAEDKTTQRGYSIGTSLYPVGLPIGLGYEQFDDGGNVRKDYGVMYYGIKDVILSAHRVEDDDIGFTFNYFGAVYNQGPMEYGVYLHHDKGMVGPYGNRNYDDSFKATIKYNF